ncbi:MAG: TIGR04013 family B12-binding domain/radical SAM domain-containing protein [Methanolinea sp.]|nr:TIGR04013 family B12-binding domain/radical SAM domain-containing protein [Methanolinea sp.]
MDTCWRDIPAARNSYAALYAACEREGYILRPVDAPEGDVTCYSLNSLNAHRYLPEIARAPCTTIVGGPHATACYRELVSTADYVVVGEGEYTLPALLSSIERGTDPPPGVATRDGFRPAECCVRLDAYPAFTRMKGYIEISRGCPHGCTYCQTPRIFGHAMRHRSIDAIAREAKKYRDVRFVTPNALAYGSDGLHPRLDRVRSLLSALRSPGRNVWFGTFPSEVRPDWITREALDLVSTYCSNTRVHLGAQSGSDRVLQSVGRGHTVADAVAAIELVVDAGLVPVVDFIVGFPCETEEDQEKTAEFIRWTASRGYVHIHRFIPLPGTPLTGREPRPLSPRVERLLGRLALNGRLTGSWRDRTQRFF